MEAAAIRRNWTLSELERNALLDSLDRGAIAGGVGLDVNNRVRYRQVGLELAVTYTAGGGASFSVFGRNLGQHGMSVLHAGFLHTRTECRITLPTVWNSKECVAGTVAACRHAGGLAHEVEIAFREPIDLRWFVERNPALARLLSQNADLSKLRGRVLLLDDHAIENELVMYHLRGTQIEVAPVTRPGDAIDLFKKRPFDLMLCDLDLGDERGEDVITQLRKMGFTGPLLALTGETNPVRLRGAKDAGASGIIEKPVDRPKLLSVLSEWLSDTSGKGEPATEGIYSSLADAPGSVDMVRSYLDYARRLIAALQHAIESDSVPDARKACLMLKESGGAAGFATLSQAALDAVVALDASSSMTESMRQITHLRTVASRLRAEPAPARVAA